MSLRMSRGGFLRSPAPDRPLVPASPPLLAPTGSLPATCSPPPPPLTEQLLRNETSEVCLKALGEIPDR